MTTIAYKSGIMACDSAWTNGANSIATLATKIVRLSSGALLGEAGDNDSRSVVALLDKVKCFAKMPTAKDLADCKVDYAGLIAFPNGEVAEISIEHCEDAKEWRGQVWKVNRGFAAVGSGGELAIGFMGAKRSAKEAVEFACSWDPNSRVPVHAVSVKQMKPVGRSRRRSA
jgi:ATP-dependent protease HslVU (ClpYQ) peptidase subunit